MRLPVAVAVLAVLAGCSQGTETQAGGAAGFDAMSAEEHLACAVDISAYSYLMAGGKVPEDAERAGQAALALAWHHNAYAVPLGKGEQHETINRRRAALMAKDPPKAIAARASDCIAAAVAKHETA